MAGCIFPGMYGSKRAWSAGLVQVILDYSLSLWKFCCALLHGRSKEEARQKLLSRLHQQATEAYQNYLEDPFIMAHNLRHIFYIPLQQHPLQDVDSLKCFLSTHEVALEQQERIRLQQAKTAQQFFLPCSLPTVIQQPDSDDGRFPLNLSAISIDLELVETVTHLSLDSHTSTTSMTSSSTSCCSSDSGGSLSSG
jgi:hypothetical protein